MQGAVFKIKSAFYIHPKMQSTSLSNNRETVTVKPFYGIIKNIQKLRREYPKGHIKNAMYKEIGNGIYGNVCRGISNKMNFDSLTKKSFRVTATNLSNPILAS